MIITNIYGGLGNQMFQYAFGKSLAIEKNLELKLDITPFEKYALRKFELDKFNISCQIAKNEELNSFTSDNRYIKFLLRKVQHMLHINSKLYFEREIFRYDPTVFKSNSKYFYGYWQSYLYFEKIKNILVDEFTLKSPLDTDNESLLQNIRNTNSVSVHIRRGDYVNLSKLRHGHALVPISYYEKAIGYVTEKVLKPIFYVFSDDIGWVKSNLTFYHPVNFVDWNNHSPEKDLILIKSCKHNIIANSSFSWWGAWLNDYKNKIVTIPDIWLNDLKTPADLIPSSFHVIRHSI